LGAIVVKNEIITDIQIKIDGLIKQSIEYAFSSYPALTDYIKDHAQEMSEAVMLKHIDLYVNDYSIALGEQGRNAVKKLMEVYQAVNQTKSPAMDVFV
jgi:1,4-dihydroxy-6-naphthoate synthase